jgi:HK97 family phage portal protein
MGIFNNFFGLEPTEQKSTTVITTQEVELPQHSSEEVRAQLGANDGFGPYTPIQISAVFSCARVIAEGLAQVPCLLQKRSKSGGFEAAVEHPLYRLLNRAPNSFMTAYEFREWMGFHLALLGNAFVFVIRNHLQQPIEFLPIPAGAVKVNQPDANWTVTYEFGGKVYSNRQIWHLKGPSWNSFDGMSPQVVAARAIGLAADLEAFGSQVFRNGSRPSGILSTENNLDEDKRLAMQSAWNAQQAGIANAHRTPLLTNGLKFVPIQTTPDDAQFIESRRYQIEEICRIMRVDPLMVQQATNSASYASIEQRFLAHLTHCLKPMFARFEQSAEVNLLTEAEQAQGFRVHFDTRDLSLGTSLDRANYYGIMRQNGLLTINECREHEGLDRSNNETADLLTPSANLFGPDGQASSASD